MMRGYAERLFFSVPDDWGVVRGHDWTRHPAYRPDAALILDEMTRFAEAGRPPPCPEDETCARCTRLVHEVVGRGTP